MSSLKFLEVQALNSQSGHLTLDHIKGTLVPVVQLREGEGDVEVSSTIFFQKFQILHQSTNSKQQKKHFKIDDLKFYFFFFFHVFFSHKKKNLFLIKIMLIVFIFSLRFFWYPYVLCIP
jgi:hypothetical protein